ncbi:MAG: aminotransferase class IV [Deltaproteobacteria bacterium]|nr:aminotransferase class IV [Deltaproteobacteria bacterium]MBW2067392.1 aminotransferase class IV [Deltaproteobacteria bacterium]
MDRPLILSPEEIYRRLCEQSYNYHSKYLAMYSSWFGGIVRDPSFMLMPIDDHMVHRGDGVFEVFKCVGGRLYLVNQHLDRLERSAAVAELKIPMSRQELLEVVKQTVLSAGEKDCLIRLFVSRGPGGFSARPSESIGSQVYIVVTTIPQHPKEHYAKGVKVKTSRIPMKPPFFASVKSCNYLPNVLMSKEAEEEGVEFTISVDERGNIGEGPTENIGIITTDYAFLVPRFNKVLRGITISRMMELAGELIKAKVLSHIGEADIPLEEAYRAQEVMMFGTTFDVLPVVMFNNKKIGNGQPGPFYKKFLKLLREDMSTDSEVTLKIYD